jgi:hypothetical protein
MVAAARYLKSPDPAFSYQESMHKKSPLYNSCTVQSRTYSLLLMRSSGRVKDPAGSAIIPRHFKRGMAEKLKPVRSVHLTKQKRAPLPETSFIKNPAGTGELYRSWTPSD